MKKLIISIIIAGMLIFGLSMGVMAETSNDTSTVNVNISEIALVDAGDPNNLVIDATAISAGAAPYISVADGNSVLKYTSIVAAGETRLIQAKLDAVVAGCNLKLVCAQLVDGTASADGTVGAVVAINTLTTADATLISTIGSCNSGDTGATLTYTLSIDDIANVKADTNALTITFTITAGS